MRTVRSPSSTAGHSFSLGRALVGLPLCLACFAALLQLTNRQDEEHTLYLVNGVVSDQDSYLPQRQPPRVVVEAAASQARRMASQTARRAVQHGLATDWKAQDPNPGSTKIAFVVTTSESLTQIRVWLAYHRAIGVTIFYMFVDGQAGRPEIMAELQKEPGVKVIPKDEKLRKMHTNSRIWNETWLSAFFHKPCNHELFVVQSLNMEIGIRMARADKADWLLHIDTDELVFPSGSVGFSLQEVLSEVPADVDTLIFPNYESLPEREDVEDPFTEVTLFKKNYQHVVPDLYFKNYHTISRGNPNYFITYGNGKSAARVQRGLRPNGAHRWHSYLKTPTEHSSDQAAVLHYTYNRFSDLKSRRDRCDCAPTEEDAKRCFILPFDRMAFLEASLRTDEELLQWFRDRLVWGDPAVVNDLLKKGLLARLYEPQLMIRGFLAAWGKLPQQQPAAQAGQGTALGMGALQAEAQQLLAAQQAAKAAAAVAAEQAGGQQQNQQEQLVGQAGVQQLAEQQAAGAGATAGEVVQGVEAQQAVHAGAAAAAEKDAGAQAANGGTAAQAGQQEQQGDAQQQANEQVTIH